MPKKTMVYLKGFRAETLEIGGVRLGVLRLVKEDWKEGSLRSKAGPLDTLINYATRTSRDKDLKDTDYVEVTVEAPGLVVTHGGNPKYQWGELLYHQPVRLVRVGVVRKTSEEEAGRLVINDTNIEWHEMRGGDIYVFEGFCEADKDIVMVILETEKDRRVLTQCKPYSS